MEVENPMVMWIVRPSICPHHTLKPFREIVPATPCVGSREMGNIDEYRYHL